MRQIQVDNYVIDEPIINIVRQLKLSLVNGKLKDIRDGSDNIVVTCPHHGGGHESTPACNIYVGNDSRKLNMVLTAALFVVMTRWTWFICRFC